MQQRRYRLASERPSQIAGRPFEATTTYGVTITVPFMPRLTWMVQT